MKYNDIFLIRVEEENKVLTHSFSTRKEDRKVPNITRHNLINRSMVSPQHMCKTSKLVAHLVSGIQV